MTLHVQYVCPLLQVFDMPRSIAFYRDALGFQVVQTSAQEGDHFDWVWLLLDDADLMLNTAYYRTLESRQTRSKWRLGVVEQK
ncbi:MAG TPA: VOC family protein [Thermoanaerobaculia bacterium]|nr:VOC family protein [Thermoanaerobaculia bacterium]